MLDKSKDIRKSKAKAWKLLNQNELFVWMRHKQMNIQTSWATRIWHSSLTLFAFPPALNWHFWVTFLSLSVILDKKVYLLIPSIQILGSERKEYWMQTKIARFFQVIKAKLTPFGSVIFHFAKQHKFLLTFPICALTWMKREQSPEITWNNLASMLL